MFGAAREVESLISDILVFTILNRSMKIRKDYVAPWDIVQRSEYDIPLSIKN